MPLKPLPIGVQIIAAPWREDVALRIAHALEKAGAAVGATADTLRGSRMEIDRPEIVKEVKAAFERYERALVSNDVETLDAMFRDDPRTVRYGATEILYGYSEIKKFRAARSPAGLARTLSKTVITTFGRDFAMASHDVSPRHDAGQSRPPDANLGPIR